ncbi:MAG: CBM35 domain-containing protein [Lentisphaeria bacterium]|nr:CBM35 domain-containing protein [Lentisphaeria bacterium]
MNLLLRSTATIILSTLLAQATTQLSHQGKTLFSADTKVSYGAVYDAHAVKAVIDSPADTTIRIYTGKKPQRLFLNNDLVADSAWSYDDGASCVTLPLPAGRQALQARFDDLASVKPFAATVSISIAGKQLDTPAQATWADGQLRGEFIWNETRSGLFTAKLTDNNSKAEVGQVFVRGASRSVALLGDKAALMLQPGSVLAFTLPAPDGKVPDLRLAIAPLPGVPSLVARDRLQVLAIPDAIIVEGEKFTAERGGNVSISTSHQNTSNGGCIYSWANAGHALDWDVTVPQEGRYAITIVAATSEASAARTIAVNGNAIPDLALLQIHGTGGWGRSNAAEWQALQPQNEQGKPLALPLQKGSNTITLTNTSGQHLNIDCFVLEKIAP